MQKIDLMHERGELSGDWPHVSVPLEGLRLVAGLMVASACVLLTHNAGIPAVRIGESSSVTSIDDRALDWGRIPPQRDHNRLQRARS